MMRQKMLLAICLCAIAVAAFSVIAYADRPPAREFMPNGNRNAMVNLSEPLVFKQGGDTVWLQVYTPEDACTCDPNHGSECDGGPDGTETFCFEKYNPNTADSLYKYYGSPGTPYFSPASGNGFTTIDAKRLGSGTGEDFWHLDVYQALEGTSWWCGTLTGDRCTNYGDAPGYGPAWNQLLALDPDLPAVTPGETVKLECWVRYDTECDYDYAFLEYSNDNGATWTTFARFNASSGNAGPPCGDDYFGSSGLGQGNPPGGNVSWMSFPTNPADGYMTVTDPSQFLVGFRFESDNYFDDKDVAGNTDGAFFVDLVYVKKLDNTVLEFEDMDDEFESSKWSIRPPPGIADHWWMAYDPDPPLEPEEGASICNVNASWVWVACPFVNNRWRIPPSSNGFLYRLQTPKIYTGWGEPTVPKEYAGLVVVHDIFTCFRENFCDYYDTKVNVYNTSPFGNPANAGWCGWINIDDYITYGGCDFMNIDQTEDVSQWMGASVDTVQYAWDCLDVGATGDWCWTTTSPSPHRGTQLMVDNVSFGLYDASGTFFQSRVIDLFQDTFDLETAAHNAQCANADMPKVLATSESLTVDIHDMNGLSGALAWTRLYFSTNGGDDWDFNDMILRVPDPSNPDLGGTYIGSIHPSEIDIAPYPGVTWIPGTEVWYYIQVRDDLGNLAYWPATADPSTDPPARPYFSNYQEFSILPGVGTADAPNRILVVDDFGRNDYDYHPCMEESTVIANENIYEGVLWDLGYSCYDKYDVQGASTGLSNEPWDLVTYPDPANPDSLERRYDAVIWFTSRFDEYTVLDTMQCRLVDFVRKGGNLFICGNNLGVDMTDYGDYSDAAAETCQFYGGLIGASMEPPGGSQQGIRNPHLYAKGSGLVAGSALTAADKFHFHLGCPVSVPHDLTRLNDQPPSWAPNPTPYLVYEAGYTAGDTLVAIYNEYTGGGKVVHMCFDMAAMVDSSAVSCAKADYKGRSELMRDILLNLFGIVPCEQGGVDDFVPGARYAYSLSQNYPNPFNPDTDIEYSLRQGGRVSLKVYNVRGQVVRTLVDRSLQAGQYTAHWDGTNDHGQMVSSGIYFCKMEAGDFASTRKMILLK